MAGRLLCALMLLVVLEMTSTYKIEISGSHNANKKLEETKDLDDLDNLLDKMHKRGSVSRKFHKVAQAKQEKTLKPEPQHNDEEDDPETISKYEKRLRLMHDDKIHEDPSKLLQLGSIAISLIPNCTVNVTRRPEERLENALRPNYQVLQHHGEESFASDEEFSLAKSSEVCAACVLGSMCEREDVLNITNMLQLESFKRGIDEEERCRLTLVAIALKVKAKLHQPFRECDESAEFRSIDGTCNNLHSPFFGATNTEFARLLVPDYGDGVSTLRLAENGDPLPNARDVSRLVHGSNQDGQNPNSLTLSVLFMNVGQFLDHDISLAEAQGVDCEPPESEENEECINIEIPHGDETFLSRDITFIEVEREAFLQPKTYCDLVPREQINIITTYLDASNVYGSSVDVANSVRDAGGLLKVTKHPQDCTLQDLLPPIEGNEGCITVDPFRPCMLSGDIRNNENQGLNSVHTIFMRRHNVIARFLGQMTDFDAERIYQVARKILGAQFQYIVFNEFLPPLLSQQNIDRFDLRLGTGFNYSTCYDKTINPGVSTAFAVAAYRFGHTLVPEIFSRPSQGFFETYCEHCSDKKNFLPITVRDFGNPHYLYDAGSGGVDAILRGLIQNATSALDGRFSTSVQENLIRGPGDLSDLVAINTVRSYERGLPGYTAFRRFCGLRPVNNFRQLRNRAGFTNEATANLRRVFTSVHDIPLFTGGLLEGRNEDGGLMAPTFQCLLAEQFRALKCGDRFWHENEPRSDIKTENTALTPCQLREIRKTLLSKIICEVSDDIPAINRFALLQSGIKTPCEKLPEVNLEPWMPDFVCEEEDSAEW